MKTKADWFTRNQNGVCASNLNIRHQFFSGGRKHSRPQSTNVLTRQFSTCPLNTLRFVVFMKFINFVTENIISIQIELSTPKLLTGKTLNVLH